MLGMYTSGGVNKVKGMIYYFMVESWKPLDLMVCCLLIRMVSWVWCSVSSYDGQESGSITPAYNLHISYSRRLRSVHHPKNPHFPVYSSSSMILNAIKYDDFNR